MPLLFYLFAFPNKALLQKTGFLISGCGLYFFSVYRSVCQLNKVRGFAQLDTLLVSAAVLLTVAKVSVQGETGNLQIPLPLLN